MPKTQLYEGTAVKKLCTDTGISQRFSRSRLWDRYSLHTPRKRHVPCRKRSVLRPTSGADGLRGLRWPGCPVHILCHTAASSSSTKRYHIHLRLPSTGPDPPRLRVMPRRVCPPPWHQAGPEGRACTE